MQLGVTVAMEAVQSFSNPPSEFEVGFGINPQQQRLTNPLPLSTPPDTLREELTSLLSWGCIEDQGISNTALVYEDYESESGPGVNSTAFCGLRSRRDPFTIWSSSNAYRLDNYPYVSRIQNLAQQ